MRLRIARLRLKERSLRVMVTVMILSLMILLLILRQLLRWILLRLLLLTRREMWWTDSGLMLKRYQLTIRSLDVLILLLPLRMMMAVMVMMAIDLAVIRLIGDISRRTIQNVELVAGRAFPRGVLRRSHDLSIHVHHYMREGLGLQTRPAILGYYLQSENTIPRHCRAISLLVLWAAFIDI